VKADKLFKKIKFANQFQGNPFFLSHLYLKYRSIKTSLLKTAKDIKYDMLRLRRL